jgi:hypothetical protein
MKEFAKSKIVTSIIVLTTIVLAGVAVFTAIKLYQTGTEPVAPTVPESEPAAATPPQACRTLTFSLEEEFLTPTVTQAITPTTTATLTPATTSPTPTEGIGGGSTPTPTTSPTLTPTSAPTVTPTSSPTVTQTPNSTATPSPSATTTPAGEPLGGGDITEPSPTTIAAASPTSGQIAQTSPAAGGTGGVTDDQLPAAGFAMPTVLIGILGILLLLFSIALVF